MADLGANSLWSDISNGAANVETELMGPSYSYADNIPKPKGEGGLGVGSDGSFNQLGTNMGAVGTYVGTMVSGRDMGNRYYVNTGGTCTAPDGSIQSRHNYINNVSSGLIPGIISDIGGLNPTYLMNSLMTDSSPGCKCYQCPVTSGGEFQFLTPDLSPDFDSKICKVVDPSKCPQTPSTESFSNETLVPTLIAGVALCVILLLRKK
jgi:hypothetical protein